MRVTLSRNGRRAVVTGTALVLAMSASSGALAQQCGGIMLSGPALPTSVGGGFGAPFANVVQGFATGLAASNAITSTLTATNTAFLTQSTSYVSAPANAPPNSDGGGIWVRGVGGELSIKSDSTISASVNVPGGGSASGAGGCTSKFDQTFGGFQLGQDIAKLNVGDWNLHFGSTAGLIETKGDIAGGNLTGGAFNSATQAPFVGTYVVATNGGFFIDGLARWDYYDTTLDSPSINVFQQKLDAHGVALSGSLGYNWKVPDSNWFIEPSAGLIWSQTRVDPFNTLNTVSGSSGFINGNFQGTAQISDITSTIGRAALRFGTTFESGGIVWQPFAALSVWHEFESATNSTYMTCTNCFFYNTALGSAAGSLSAAISNQNIGTFGQYSLGLSGQIANTGWLGFARVDYRDGPRLEGIDGTGGIRYQFTPTGAPGAMMPVKAPVYKAPMSGPYNWAGLYVGGFGGAGYGHTDIGFPNTSPALATVAPKVAGALFGGEIGYNYQFGPWVLGFEGDDGWTNTRGTTPCSGLSAAFSATQTTPLFQMNCQDQIDWIATATGRLGYASGRVLYYGKVGAAWEHDSVSATCNLGTQNSVAAGTAMSQLCTNPANVVSNGFSASTDRVGWTAGFGTEFGLTPNWSAKGEIDYIDFGNRALTASDGTLLGTSIRLVEAKIGVNYHFTP